jgi:hypothetical protein
MVPVDDRVQTPAFLPLTPPVKEAESNDQFLDRRAYALDGCRPQITADKKQLNG